jgi:hypothetical protein
MLAEAGVYAGDDYQQSEMFKATVAWGSYPPTKTSVDEGWARTNHAYLMQQGVDHGAPHRRRGVKGVSDPPEHLLTSFRTILIVEFGGHLPTLPSF